MPSPVLLPCAPLPLNFHRASPVERCFRPLKRILLTRKTLNSFSLFISPLPLHFLFPPSLSSHVLPRLPLYSAPPNQSCGQLPILFSRSVRVSMSALLLAVQRCDLESVKRLVAEGADVKKTILWGYTPFIRATPFLRGFLIWVIHQLCTGC
jgi:hypothetical protein